MGVQRSKFLFMVLNEKKNPAGMQSIDPSSVLKKGGEHTRWRSVSSIKQNPIMGYMAAPARVGWGLNPFAPRVFGGIHGCLPLDHSQCIRV